MQGLTPAGQRIVEDAAKRHNDGKNEGSCASRVLLCFDLLDRNVVAALAPAVPEREPGDDDRDDRKRLAERDPPPSDRCSLGGALLGRDFCGRRRSGIGGAVAHVRVPTPSAKTVNPRLDCVARAAPTSRRRCRPRRPGCACHRGKACYGSSHACGRRPASPPCRRDRRS